MNSVDIRSTSFPGGTEWTLCGFLVICRDMIAERMRAASYPTLNELGRMLESGTSANEQSIVSLSTPRTAISFGTRSPHSMAIRSSWTARRSLQQNTPIGLGRPNSHFFIAFPSGRTLAIEAPGASENRYVARLSLNGAELPRNYLRRVELQQGGRLSFTMSAQPVKTRGTSPDAAPYSMSRH